METVITTMALLVGGLLMVALAVAGWEAMQRNITERLAAEAYAANASALERPFLQSQPNAAAAVPHAGAPAVSPESTRATSPAAPGSPDAEQRRAVVAQALQHAARPDSSAAAPARAPAATDSPTSWLDTVPATTLTLTPGAFDLKSLSAALDTRPAPPPSEDTSVVAEGRESVDLLLH